MKGPESNDGSYSAKMLGNAKGEEATQERCRAILETIAPGRVRYSEGSGVYYILLPPGGAALWVYLALWDDDSIGVRIYPGNIMSQARKFFERARKQEFFELESKGWEIQPNLYFGYRDWSRLAYGNKLSGEQYFDYWASDEIRQVHRKDNGFEDFSQQLHAHRLINAKDQSNIKKDFIETKRDFMNVCPGFELIFSWRRAEANRLDRDHQFVEAVRDRANEALRTWGQTL
jgi:hypothetical protein